jgi:hypothetical protein
MSPNLEPPQGNFFSGRGGGPGGSKRERGREIKKERSKEIAENKIPEQTAG